MDFGILSRPIRAKTRKGRMKWDSAAGASLKNGSMMKNGMQESKGFEIWSGGNQTIFQPMFFLVAEMVGISPVGTDNIIVCVEPPAPCSDLYEPTDTEYPNMNSIGFVEIIAFTLSHESRQHIQITINWINRIIAHQTSTNQYIHTCALLHIHNMYYACIDRLAYCSFIRWD